MRNHLTLVLFLGATAPAAADEIPTVTLTDVGPDQEVPAGRSFYLAGSAEAQVEAAQAIVVRVGSPRLFAGRGPDCATVMRDLRIDATAHSAADDDDDDDAAPAPLDIPTLHAGTHHAFELFPRAELGVRDAAVLVSAPWRRGTPSESRYRVLVPGDAEFFATGYRFCTFVVSTDHQQIVDDQALDDLIDALGKKLVDCGDKASCANEALDDYEARLARILTRARGPSNGGKLLAARLKEVARVELGAATGIIEARDRFDDKWHPSSQAVMPAPPAQPVWLDIASDPFAFAVTSLLARSAALVPQVRPNGAVSLVTNDGKLAVGALQILDDGRSIRVATSRAPGDKTRVLTATTDTLAIAEGLQLDDLIELGRGKLRVDHTFITLEALAARVAALGLEEWTAEDAAFLGGALAQLRRLDQYAEAVTLDTPCRAGPIGTAEAELTPASTDRHLGEWLACRKLDLKALDTLVELLDDLVKEDGAWKQARDQVATHSRRVVTMTTTGPLPLRLTFETSTWVFSYLTPIAGVAGVLRTDESFGLGFVGVELHLDPNPIHDVPWSHGVTGHDLRRAMALELGVAPTGDGFGPDARFGGPGKLPPVFLGVALHVIPYTSLSFGVALLDRRRSTLVEEEAHVVASPYVGFSIQLNLPDLVRHAVLASSNTRANQ